MSYQELPTYDQMADADDMWGVEGIEVKEATPADWLRATVGMHMHVMGELVKQPSGASTEGWALL